MQRIRRGLGAKELAALVLPVLAAACGGASDGAATLEAALVPGADLVIRVDAEAVREAPFFAALEGDDEPRATPPGTDDDPEFDSERFLEVTGLKAEDLVAVLISADLEEVELGEAAEPGGLGKMVGVAGARLARPLDLDTLEKGLRESVRGEKRPTFSRVEVSGTPALKVDSPEPDEPDVLIASIADGHTLLAAPDEASLAGALERSASGSFASLPDDLQTVYASLPADAQGRVAFVLPARLREGIRKQLDDPANAMAAGMAAPFRDFRSLAIGLAAAADLRVALAAHLGEESAAQQAQALLGGMVAPMARSALADALEKPAAEIEDRLSVAASGSTLEITLRLFAEDARTLRAKREAQAAITAPAEEE